MSDEILTDVQAADIAAFVDEANRVPGMIAGERVTTCKACDRLGDDMECLETGASIPTRSWIVGAVCPLGKWSV